MTIQNLHVLYTREGNFDKRKSTLARRTAAIGEKL